MRILGLGNALTDVLAQLHSDDTLVEMNLLKGGMKLFVMLMADFSRRIWFFTVLKPC